MTPREREVALLVERDFSNYESSLSSKRARDLCRWIAYHEAGHAAVARKLGVWIADIEMTPSHDRAASVQTRSALWVAKQAGGDQASLARGLYADLMVALAGEAAERLAGYPEIPGHGDIDNSINCAWRLTFPMPPLCLSSPCRHRRRRRRRQPLLRIGEGLLPTRLISKMSQEIFTVFPPAAARKTSKN